MPFELEPGRMLAMNFASLQKNWPSNIVGPTLQVTAMEKSSTEALDLVTPLRAKVIRLSKLCKEKVGIGIIE